MAINSSAVVSGLIDLKAEVVPGGEKPLQVSDMPLKKTQIEYRPQPESKWKSSPQKKSKNK